MIFPKFLLLALSFSTVVEAFPSILFLVLCLPAVVYHIYAIYTSLAFFSNPTKANADFNPPVTILKPICGLDIDTYDNFASFARQNYPTYQIIFSVRDRKDPVIKVVKQIIQDYPKVDIQLVVNDRTLGSNLKVGNLSNAQTLAKYDIFLLADSDVRVGPNYLRRVIQPLHKPEVGVVTCLYRPVTRGWVANVEALGISTHYLACVMVANQLGSVQFALGPTIAIRRTLLEKIGGFAAISEYLADDFQLGYLSAQASYKVVLSDYVIDHLISTISLTDLFHRQVRWACCTRVSRFWGYVGLIFSHGIVTSLLFLFLTGGSFFGWFGFGLTWITRLSMAWIVGAIGLRDSSVKKFLWLVPLSDLINFLIWLYSFSSNRIEWRGQKMLLTRGGKLVPLEVEAAAAYSSSSCTPR